MILVTAAIYKNNFFLNRYTIHQYKRSFLQSSNVYIKVTSLLQYIPTDDGLRLGRNYFGNN